MGQDAQSLLPPSRLSSSCADLSRMKCHARTLHGRDKTELLEHAEHVINAPLFRDLAAFDADNIDGRDSHLLASWGDAPKRSLLCSTHRQADDHLVPFRDHVLNRDVQIRETCQHHADGLSGFLGTDW